jgi:hypothetical protein
VVRQPRRLGALIGFATLAAILVPLQAQASPARDLSSPSAAAVSRVTAALRAAPLSFVQNRGQIHGPVPYYVQGSDASLYFASDGVTFALTGRRTGPLPEARGQMGPTQRWLVKATFVGANPSAVPVAEHPGPTVVSYFTGRPSDWTTGLPTYSTLLYRSLWPGIDLQYSGSADRLKYSFVVQPGTDPSAIQLGYRGADAVSLTPSTGALSVSTPVGGFQDAPPYAYQVIDGRRVTVPSAYVLQGTTVSFRLGAYDRSLPLVVDPDVIVYAGYIGGAGKDVAFRMAVDSEGAAYVTGETSSPETSFPAAVGPDLTYNGGDVDGWVAKVSPDGTSLEYAGYIGGAGTDTGLSIAVDESGAAYVTGGTSSDETTFPVTVGPDLTYNGGTYDAFVAKVSPDGTSLEYCGYIGGDGEDQGMRIDLDSSDNAYVGGYTASRQDTFPVKVGPDLTYGGGLFDGFVAKVSTDGTGLIYAGYIGGNRQDRVRGVAVDVNGAVYLSGYTASRESTFPVKAGPDLTYNGGKYDGWVAKVGKGGQHFVYAGYIGGSGTDMARGIAVDATGAAYVSGGITESDQTTFPVTVGPDLTYNGGKYDTWIAKVSPDGTTLDYCGYIGGARNEEARMVAVDSLGRAYVVGWTNSDENSFPVVGGPDLTFNGGPADAFLAIVDPSGAFFDDLGYIGGAGDDKALGVGIDADGSAYISGATDSQPDTFPVQVGPSLNYGGGDNDAFVVKVAVT